MPRPASQKASRRRICGNTDVPVIRCLQRRCRRSVCCVAVAALRAGARHAAERLEAAARGPPASTACRRTISSPFSKPLQASVGATRDLRRTTSLQLVWQMSAEPVPGQLASGKPSRMADVPAVDAGRDSKPQHAMQQAHPARRVGQMGMRFKHGRTLGHARQVRQADEAILCLAAPRPLD